MITNYISFDAKKYLKDYYYFKGVINGLKEKYEALDGTKAVAVTGDKVQTTPSPDAMEKIALERVLLGKKIADYEHHIEQTESAFRQLIPEEKEIIEIFFDPDSKLEWYDKGYSRSTAFALRKEALTKLSIIIIGTEKID